MDVSALAKRLDKRLTKPPSAAEQKRGRAKSLPVARLKLKAAESAVLLEALPEPVSRSGWLQVFVPDGELRREGDRLYYSSDRSGSKELQVFNLVYED